MYLYHSVRQFRARRAAFLSRLHEILNDCLLAETPLIKIARSSPEDDSFFFLTRVLPVPSAVFVRSSVVGSGEFFSPKCDSL